MKEKKPASPATIAGMIVAIVAALGFLGWRVVSLMSPPAPVRVAAPVSADGATAKPIASATPQTPAAAGLETRVSPQAPGSAAVATPAPPRLRQPGDASAAVGVEPMTPLGEQELAAERSRYPIAPTGPIDPKAAVKNTRTVYQGSAAALPALDSRPSQPMAITPMPTSPIGPPPQPELTGTMVGSRPTGLFKSGAGVVLVPQGSTINGWKVLRVTHGEAVIWAAGVTARLRVGLASTSTQPEIPSLLPSPVRASTVQPASDGNSFQVRWVRSTPLTREDLVMGRLEESPADLPRTEGDPTTDEQPETPGKQGAGPAG